MKTTCVQWKDGLLEAALGEAAPGELENHLSQCRDCAAELAALRSRRERLDALLPLLAGAAEPSPNLGRRILAATEARPAIARPWAFAGLAAIGIAGAVIAAVVIALSWAFHRESNVTTADLRGAQALAQWHAPTDVLLEFPGREFLEAVPRLGDSYIKIPVRKERGGK